MGQILHIKTTLLKCIGDLLNGSGWTSAISQANIATPGTAERFLQASHVKKTARAHQVTGDSSIYATTRCLHQR